MRSAAVKTAISTSGPRVRQAAVLAVLLILLLSGCSTPRGIYHTVTEGQTLYRISRAYGVDERYLARINRIGDPTQLRAGQRLFIPGADRPRPVAPSPGTGSQAPAPATAAPVPVSPGGKQPASSRPAAKVPATVPPSETRTAASLPSARQTPVARQPGAPEGGAPAHARYQGKFIWPLKGEIVRRFGEAGNPPCKGLEIAAGRGTPVLSAAPGHVIYSGDGIRSYGNLVILRHDDDFFTVYGYNDSNLVKAGSFVSKGDRIALSGVSPGGGAPRLYFEIRRGKEAVNPIFYLP